MKIKLLPLLFICFILIQSCEKPDPNGCHNAVIFYNYLSDAARNQTPYFTNPAFDTISFASDKGDTLIFVKTKTDSTWYKEEIRGNPACDWDKNYFQILHNTYTTIKGSGTFDLRHSKKNNSGNIDIIELHFNDFVFYTGDRMKLPRQVEGPFHRVRHTDRANDILVWRELLRLGGLNLIQ